jgi:hypothetical protein
MRRGIASTLRVIGQTAGILAAVVWGWTCWDFLAQQDVNATSSEIRRDFRLLGLADAIQLDRPDPGAIAGADHILRLDGDLIREQQPVTGVPVSDGTELHRILRHHGISLLALTVPAFCVEADDGVDGLLTRSGAGHGGVRTAHVDRMEK